MLRMSIKVLPSFWKIMTDRPTNATGGHEDTWKLQFPKRILLSKTITYKQIISRIIKLKLCIVRPWTNNLSSNNVVVKQSKVYERNDTLIADEQINRWINDPLEIQRWIFHPWDFPSVIYLGLPSAAISLLFLSFSLFLYIYRVSQKKTPVSQNWQTFLIYSVITQWGK